LLRRLQDRFTKARTFELLFRNSTADRDGTPTHINRDVSTDAEPAKQVSADATTDVDQLGLWRDDRLSLPGRGFVGG
jgi:hypothetical protein